MLWLSLIHHLWGMSDNVGYFLIFFWYFGIPCAFESFLHVFPCKAVRGLAGLMPSQLAEMALLVLASVKRFIKRSESNETLSLSAMETNENQWNHFFLFNSFYSFLLDSLDEPVDRVKDPERSERPELLTHALRVRASVSLPDLSDLCHYWTWWNGKESCSDDQRPRIDMVW